VSRAGLVALVVVTMLASGCGPGHTDRPQPGPSTPPTAPSATTASTATTATPATTAMPSATLTAATPVARLPITPVEQATTVRLSIASLDNPTDQAITLSVALIRPDGTIIEVGTASPFPADRPAVLHVAMPTAAIEQAAIPGTILRVNLVPLEQPLRPDLRLVVAATIEPT